MAKETKTASSLRSQLKATSLKKLQKQIDDLRALLGAYKSGAVAENP